MPETPPLPSRDRTAARSRNHWKAHWPIVAAYVSGELKTDAEHREAIDWDEIEDALASAMDETLTFSTAFDKIDAAIGEA